MKKNRTTQKELEQLSNQFESLQTELELIRDQNTTNQHNFELERGDLHTTIKNPWQL